MNGVYSIHIDLCIVYFSPVSNVTKVNENDKELSMMTVLYYDLLESIILFICHVTRNAYFR